MIKFTRKEAIVALGTAFACAAGLAVGALAFRRKDLPPAATRPAEIRYTLEENSIVESWQAQNAQAPTLVRIFDFEARTVTVRNAMGPDKSADTTYSFDDFPKRDVETARKEMCHMIAAGADWKTFGAKMNASSFRGRHCVLEPKN